jgi:hypothetical protein
MERWILKNNIQMNNLYRKFFCKFYDQTNGFIPTKPVNQNVYPGDFFQIRNREMIFLGNIFSSSIVDPKNIEFGQGIQLNPSSWDFYEGVTKPYSGRGTGHNALEGEFEFSKQILAFHSKGSFFFRGKHPESVKILNWSSIQDELIIKLTQTHFSFRNVYVVTEIATTSDWTLAIASSEKAELEIATGSENFGLVDIFGHGAAKTVQSKDIDYYHREPKRKPSFFKAKKLAVQNEKLDVLVDELIHQRIHKNEWATHFYEHDIYHDTANYSTQLSHNSQISLLDMLPGNQLNPNTALQYFKWVDANLDDIGKLFVSNED